MIDDRGVKAREPEDAAVVSQFTADRAAALGGPSWLRARRLEAAEELSLMPMPSEKEEVWRYTPIDQLRLEDFTPDPGGDAQRLGVTGSAFVEGVAADLLALGALVTVVDGKLASIDRRDLPDSVFVGGLPLHDHDPERNDPGPLPGPLLAGGDLFVRLNDAFHPDAVVVDVPPGIVLDAPIVVVHWCSSGARTGRPEAPAIFPRTWVRVGRGASAQVVEVVAGASDAKMALVVPFTELRAEDGSHLAYGALQVLGADAWHIGRLVATAGRDATLRTFTVGLGGAYDRTRTDAVAQGEGATTELRSAYLGTGQQVHDVRTLQDHAAPHTTSDLLCKGAVAGTSRSVYSGLIRVRRGAVRTNAFQTNHNLVLAEGAHADSVPNLDIEENDVRCSHASTVGPVDEDQRYYLESRGIPPTRAEQLIVLGFFDDIIQRSPVPALVPRLRREVGLRLASTLELDLESVHGADDAAVQECVVAGSERAAGSERRKGVEHNG
jgi:Fe-S cluster assembly protein SufD